MNSLERSAIEKAGYDHGFENVDESTPERVALSSSRHRAVAHVTSTNVGRYTWLATFPGRPSLSELRRSFPDLPESSGTFQVSGEAALGNLFRRAAELAMALPNQAANDYTEAIEKLELNPPSTTEALQLAKQRIGQDKFRAALLDYWQGSCAVTGIAVPELLRASHAKPWADCSTVNERLNVYNGFLLAAHLDALFDQGLMTFDDEGAGKFSPQLDSATLEALHLSVPISLRWIRDAHRPFLHWHREQVFKSTKLCAL